MDDTIDNQLEKLNDIHWLIGIIEGEGCFTLNVKQKYGKLRKAYCPTIQITNTNIRMIEECKRILSDNGLTCYFYSYLPKKNKPYFRLEITGLKRIPKFMNVFYKHFRCRKEQAKKLKEYCELRLSKSVNASITNEEHKIAEELYKLTNSKNNSLS